MRRTCAIAWPSRVSGRVDSTVARQPVTAVTKAPPIRSECLFDADARQRGVDSYAKSAGNAERVQLPATTSHHREVVSRGGHHTFVRPSDGCADAEAPVAGPHPANACQPPSAPCGVGAGPTSWTAIPAWQHLDGRALPTRRTSPASRRPPRMGTRHPIPLLPTGKPLRGTTPLMMMMIESRAYCFSYRCFWKDFTVILYFYDTLTSP